MEDRALKKISDLGLAAALINYGYQLHGTNQNEDGRVYFQFINSNYIENRVAEYRANKLTVRARSYHDNMKMLKGLIYAEK